MTDLAYHDALPPQHRLHWYVLERVLGQGGFGITYLARDTNLDLPVAIKEYLPSEVATRLPDGAVRSRTEGQRERYRWGLERFILEARTLAHFDHPNIVRVYSVFELNGTAYMVMQFEAGGTLGALLEQRGILSEEELLRILLPILDGLELVHKAGFIHRDVKPDNIHLRDDATPVLLDFGSARHALGKAHTLTILVAPGYAPFEQYYSSAESQGPWTDIYGLGATCYRAIAGVPPLDSIARSKGILGSTRDVLVPAQVIGKGRYSERVLAAIDHALAFAEKDRPQTVAEWRNELVAQSSEPAPSTAARQAIAELNDHSDSTALRSIAGATDYAAGGMLVPGASADARARSSNVRVRMVWAAVGAGLAVLATGIALTIQAPDRSLEEKIAQAKQQLEQERSQLVLARQASEEKKRQDDEERKTWIEQQARAKEAQHQEQPKTRPTAAALSPKQGSGQNPVVGSAVVRSKIESATAPAAASSPIAGSEPARSKTEPPAEPAAASSPVAGSEPARSRTEPTAALSAAPTSKDSAAPLSVPERSTSSGTAAPALAPAIPAPPTPAERYASAQRAVARGDFTGAVATLKALAEAGDARAQTKLGDMHATGHGVARDDAAAAGWYRKAAEQGDTVGQISLGNLYESGRGMRRNYNQAYIWYSLAMRNGSTTAAADRIRMASLLQPAEIRQADRVVDSMLAR